MVDTGLPLPTPNASTCQPTPTTSNVYPNWTEIAMPYDVDSADEESDATIAPIVIEPITEDESDVEET